VTNSNFINQLTPELEQRFRQYVAAGDTTGAQGITNPYSQRSLSTPPNFQQYYGPTWRSYSDSNDIYKQYLSYFGLTESGIGGVLSDPGSPAPPPPGGQPPPADPPVQFPPTPPSVLPPSSGPGSGGNIFEDLPPEWAGELIDFDPQLAFRTFLERNQTGNFGDQRFLQSQFNNVWGDYAGQLGSEFIDTNQIPETSFFNEYLPQKFDPQDYLRQFNPSDRGQGTTGSPGRATFNFRR